MLDHSKITSTEKALQALQLAYENLREDRIDQLLSLYAAEALFKDPFHEVVGRNAIKTILIKMYAQLDSPSFKILSVLEKEFEASILWEFHFRFKRWGAKPQRFRGVSWIEWNEDFLIRSHIDYWDPAEGIYEQIPLLGSMMRLIKKNA